MALVINTNIASLNAQRNLTASQGTLQTSLQRLSTGLRINSAKDDAAGLAVSERMTSQIRGINQAARNANDGISLAQTAEGDLGGIGNNLQRMRELAVQASNATNSASDRAALNNEFTALAAEIDRIASNSSFNGVKLLDGTFSAQSFQIGAGTSANDRIQINSISNARTSSLGGVSTSYAATTTSGVTTAALQAGDLTLNGFQVGASSAGALAGQSAASAYAIANAINAVSSSTGVTATADANTIAGGTISNFTAISANTFSINGVNVGTVAAGTTAAGQGANVAAAINAISSQTGVTASANATTGALTLTAADGRDIAIGLNGTEDSPVVAAQNKTTFLNQTGLASGVVGTRTIEGTTTAAFGAFTSPTGAATDIYSLTINGSTVISQAIGNPAAEPPTNITAANLQTALNTWASNNAADYVVTGTVSGGDVQITRRDGTGTISIIERWTNAAGTGEATGAGGGFAALSNSTYATTTATVTAAGTGSAAASVAQNRGTITLSSSNADGIVWGGANAARAGLAAAGGTASASMTSSVLSIDSVSLLTAAGAAKALTALDGALESVNTARASLGAYQNRFASVVSSLQTTSENLTAARSRIMDADFAAETAAMTRSQILQQAGTAMLAQANSLPNTVLALLRG